MRILFWSCLAGLLWTYAGYPLVMVARAAATRRRTTRPREGPALPRVDVLLAVRNAEADLEERVANLLTQDYPLDRLRVIVVSNGSQDRTPELGQEVAQREARVTFLTSPSEAGKAGALNAAASVATGEVLVFADARQRFQPRAVRRLVRVLRDPHVGAVSGRLLIDRADTAVVEGVSRYWQLETRLRLAESRTGSVVGATGAVYAIRRTLFHQLPPGLILDDVYTPMSVVQQGYRVTLEPRALAFDRPSPGYRAEYARRLRTLVGNYELLRVLPWLLSPLRNPIWGRYLSHKVLRVLTPAFCIGLLVSGALIPAAGYRGVAAGLLLIYALGVVGLIARLPGLGVPSAFVLLHTAGLAALLRPRRTAAQLWSG